MAKVILFLFGSHKSCNSEMKTRKRAKITAGEVIVFENFEILIEG